MRFDDDQIVAFLLGDLPDELASQLRDQLRIDADLADRAAELREILGLLEQPQEQHEPPTGLVERTLERILAEERPATENDEAVSNVTDPAVTCPPTSDQRSTRPQPVRAPFGGRLSAADSTPQRRSLWDSSMLTLSLTVLCCLALPAVVRIRFESRKAQCANNVRETGQALGMYALTSPEQRLPQVEATGPASFAGSFALKLNDAQLLRSIEQLFCPSVLNSGYDLRSRFAGASQQLLEELPPVSQLVFVDPELLTAIQTSAGGDYAYILGILEKGIARAPRFGQSHLAVLADAPVFIDGRESFLAHDGRGMNVLYCDGRVQFISVPKQWSEEETVTLAWPLPTDDPFRNAAGEHRPGLHLNDASIAPSSVSPAGVPTAGLLPAEPLPTR